MASPTPSPERILTTLQGAMASLRALGVVRLGVFGSRARGVARADSDLDVLVTLERGRDLIDLVTIRDALEDITGLRVDIVTESGLAPEAREAILRDVRYAA